ncbi:hypothetical protein SKAU_G00231990 [Synaphobranchus kaupii]|uniref:Uncharacterized protein n=1 Tax=Synaphobranchus kaupii TaxID=118154 RepID=A0A9Q1F5V2_SYNKA|nr:hypothetical protein SKAU_G00231990 [Synaphobranchus kaupii]
MIGLKACIEQKRKIHEDEIHTLNNKLQRMTITMQEKETTLHRKLAEEEARTAQTNEKFREYKDDIKKITKERQDYLKNELAYRDTEQRLTKERRKTADLQRRLEELNEKLAEHNQTPSCGNACEDAPQPKQFKVLNTLPRTSRRRFWGGSMVSRSISAIESPSMNTF